MKLLTQILTLGIFLFLVIACQKEDDVSTLSTEQQMNQFIEESMKDIYLWADQVKKINPNLSQEPEDFLKDLRYQEDRWSYIEKDETTSRSIVNGKAKSFGYKIQFFKISKELVYGIILFVYNNSPAEKAGLKRGDLIVTNNGEPLTEKNYTELLDAETVTLKTGQIRNNTLYTSKQDYHLSQEIIDQNPILLDTILQQDQKKIGYLVYVNFFDNQSTHLPQLSQAIRKMKNTGIDEFILDLRYNIGGTESAAQRLCSLLAPATHVRNKEVFIQKQWNSTYQNRIKAEQLVTRFDNNVLADNLDLQKIYILTSSRTASASEVVISGLRPYIPQMTIIGSQTNGKYVGMLKMTAKASELQKWVLWPVTFTYTNIEGESVKGGITPNYIVKEYDNFLPPFGDPTDPLLNKALTLIHNSTSLPSGRSNTNPETITSKWQAIGKVEITPLLGL